MHDEQIIDLYWSRSENAISETSKKYGNYCKHIAYAILHNSEDTEECVNDTYLKAWNTIPPQRPTMLSTFLGKITRNIAINKCKYYNAEKRGAGQISLALEELQECIPSVHTIDQITEDHLLIDLLNQFLKNLSVQNRKIFIRRYWYLSSIKEIAKDFRLSESNTKMILLRTRNGLRQFLEKEGIQI